MTLQWLLDCLLNRLFTQIKGNVKAARHWPLWGESAGDRWIPLTKGQWRGNVFIRWRHHGIFGQRHHDMHIPSTLLSCMLYGKQPIPVESHKMPTMQNFDDFVFVNLYKLLSKRPRGRWNFQMRFDKWKVLYFALTLMTRHCKRTEYIFDDQT